LLQFFKIPIVLVAVLLSGGLPLSSIFPAEDQSTTASGIILYHRLSCCGCHILKGQGGKEGPNLDGVASRLLRQELEVQLTTPRHRQSSSRMPSFAFMRPNELQNIMDFLQTLK
jgi:hypothetical protein